MEAKVQVKVGVKVGVVIRVRTRVAIRVGARVGSETYGQKSVVFLSNDRRGKRGGKSGVRVGLEWG